jgi:2-C-methyl-D-erythritol 4-phosphate cytidylyltransferase
MNYVTAIVLAAGKGLRFKGKTSKALFKINAHPVIIYCLKVFSQHPEIKEIILVVNSQNKKNIIRKLNQYRIRKIKKVVLGGKLRQDSVSNGLKAIDRRTDLVLIHDGVRPFINQKMVFNLIKAAKRYGAAILGVPVRATIKKVLSSQSSVISKVIVKETLNRKNLWEIQTPQVFKKGLILRAYEKFGNIEVTDDARLVEKLGVPVRIVFGSYNNIKITTSDDLILAEAILKSRKS